MSRTCDEDKRLQGDEGRKPHNPRTRIQYDVNRQRHTSEDMHSQKRGRASSRADLVAAVAGVPQRGSVAVLAHSSVGRLEHSREVVAALAYGVIGSDNIPVPGLHGQGGLVQRELDREDEAVVEGAAAAFAPPVRVRLPLRVSGLAVGVHGRELQCKEEVVLTQPSPLSPRLALQALNHTSSNLRYSRNSSWRWEDEEGPAW